MVRTISGLVAASTLLLAGCVADPAPAPPVPVDDDPVEPEPEEEALAPTLQAALTQFGACMSMDVWVGSGIYQLYDAQTADENEQECANIPAQQCQACHSTLEGGAGLSDDILWSFEQHTQFPAVMRLVTGTVDERGNFKTLVPSNRYIDKGTEAYLDPGQCHPRYTLPDYQQKAVSEFVQETLDRWQNGNCDAPYLPGNE